MQLEFNQLNRNTIYCANTHRSRNMPGSERCNRYLYFSVLPSQLLVPYLTFLLFCKILRHDTLCVICVHHIHTHTSSSSRMINQLNYTLKPVLCRRSRSLTCTCGVFSPPPPRRAAALSCRRRRFTSRRQICQHGFAKRESLD